MNGFWSLVLAAVVTLVAAANSMSVAAQSPPSEIVDGIRERGVITCGVYDGWRGFSVVDEQGNWSGFSVDFCRALAVTLLGSSDAVRYRPLSSGQRFKALNDGEVDVVVGGVVWTLSRDTEFGVRFVDTLFHDGQVFLVRRDQAVASALELSGTNVCALDGTRSVQGTQRFFGSRDMRFTLVLKKRWDDVIAAYRDNECNVLTGDMSLLAAERLRLPDPENHLILREVVSKEPMGPVIKSGDEVWFSIVRWTLMALLEAEELGLRRDNLDEYVGSEDPNIRRFLGLAGNLGQPMGLAQDWALQVVRQVGSYADIYDRNLGKASPLKLPRGVNALWTQGGLMYGAPLR